MDTLRRGSARNKSVRYQKLWQSFNQVVYTYPVQQYMEWSYIVMIYIQNHFPVLSRKNDKDIDKDDEI